MYSSVSQQSARAAKGFTHQAGKLRESGSEVAQAVKEFLSLGLRGSGGEAGAERLADLCGLRGG